MSLPADAGGVSASQLRAQEAAAARAAELKREAAIKAANAAKAAAKAAAAARTKANNNATHIRSLQQSLSQTPGAHNVQTSVELRSALRLQKTLDADVRTKNAALTQANDALRTAQGTALTAERTANDKAAVLGDKAPYAQAAGTKDLYQVGSLSAADQIALLGAPAEVTSTQVINSAAQRVQLATQANPANGAKVLAGLLAENHDPQFQKALLAATPGTLQAAGKTLADRTLSDTDRQALLQSLSQASEAAGPVGAKTIATLLAPALKGVVDANGPLANALQNCIKSNGGTLLSLQLSAALTAQGDDDGAQVTAQLTAQAVKSLKSDYDSALKTYDNLQKSLAGITSDLGHLGKTPAQLQAAIQGFKHDHAKELAAFQSASAKLAATLPGLGPQLERTDVSVSPNGPTQGANGQPSIPLNYEAVQVLKELPSLGQTPAGQRVTADALERQGAGEHTFLDTLPAISTETSNAKQYLDAVSQNTLTAASSRIIQNGGYDSQDASQIPVLAGLEKNGRLFRVDANTLAKLTEQLAKSSAATTPQTLQTYTNGLDSTVTQLSKAGPDAARVAKLFKGAGATLGLLGTVGALPTLGNSDGLQKASLVTGTAGLTTQIDGLLSGKDPLDPKSPIAKALKIVSASLGEDGEGRAAAVRILGSSAGSLASDAGAFASTAGRLVPLLTIAASGLSAIDEFSKGDTVGGTADTLIAGGTALLFTDVGTIPGVLLIAAGSVAKLWDSFFGSKPENDGGQQMDTKAALIRLGIPADKAAILDDLDHGRHYVGQYIGEVAKRLNEPPLTLLNQWLKLPDSKLKQIVSVARGIHTNTDGSLQLEPNLTPEAQRTGIVPNNYDHPTNIGDSLVRLSQLGVIDPTQVDQPGSGGQLV